jgi:hypothetical protein
MFATTMGTGWWIWLALLTAALGAAAVRRGR